MNRRFWLIGFAQAVHALWCSISQRRANVRGRRRMRRYAQCQRLEDRLALAGIPFQFTLQDPNNEFALFPNLQSTLEAAGEILGTMIEGQGSLEVIVYADNTEPRASGGVTSVSFVRRESGVDIVENSTITEGRTGVDPNGDEPDIQIFLNTEDYLPTTWFDPSGAARTGTVPSGNIGARDVVFD